MFSYLLFCLGVYSKMGRNREGWGGGGGGGGKQTDGTTDRPTDRKTKFELNLIYILRMTVLGCGLIFQSVLIACIYKNDTIIILQKKDR